MSQRRITDGIEGLTTLTELSRIGKVRLGEKTQGDKGYPRAVDYFLVKKDDITSAEAAAAFKATYGDRPKDLDIELTSNDKLAVFPHGYFCYSKSGLICRGNGIEAERYEVLTDKQNRSYKSGKFSIVECDPSECRKYEAKACKRIGRLQFMLPKVPSLGMWEIDTSSIVSIKNILSAINTLKAVTDERIKGMPLKLTLRPQKIAGSTHYVININTSVISANEARELADVGSTKEIPQTVPADIEERPTDLIPDAVIEGTDTDTAAPPKHHVLDSDMTEEGSQRDHIIFLAAYIGQKDKYLKLLEGIKPNSYAGLIKRLEKERDEFKATLEAKGINQELESKTADGFIGGVEAPGPCPTEDCSACPEGPPDACDGQGICMEEVMNGGIPDPAANAENSNPKWLRKIFAIGNNLGIETDKLKAMAYKHCDITSMKQMTIEMANSFLDFLDSYAPEVIEEIQAVETFGMSEPGNMNDVPDVPTNLDDIDIDDVPF